MLRCAAQHAWQLGRERGSRDRARQPDRMIAPAEQDESISSEIFVVHQPVLHCSVESMPHCYSSAAAAIHAIHWLLHTSAPCLSSHCCSCCGAAHTVLQELLDTYNIGADPDERNKKMVEKTAARVGFRLPDAAESPAAAAAAQDTATASIPQQQQQQEQDHPPHLSHGTAAASGGSSGSSGSSRKASSPPGPQDRLQGAASLAAA